MTSPHQRRVRSMTDEIRRLRNVIREQQKELDARDRIIAEQSKIIESYKRHFADVERQAKGILGLLHGARDPQRLVGMSLQDKT